MAAGGHTCFHCKLWVPEGEPHDCWTTTEDALTRDLPDDLREAWERLRETIGEFGEQRIYASHHSIMFARKACYAFVRPRARRLEVCIFLGRTVTGPQVKSAVASSRVKVAHILHVTHRDEVEPPLTDWLREAYEVTDELGARGKVAAKGPSTPRLAKQAATRSSPKPTKTAGAKKPVTAGKKKRASARKPAPSKTAKARFTKRATPARGVKKS